MSRGLIAWRDSSFAVSDEGDGVSSVAATSADGASSSARGVSASESDLIAEVDEEATTSLDSTGAWASHVVRADDPESLATTSAAEPEVPTCELPTDVEGPAPADVSSSADAASGAADDFGDD